jgi:hypothetical protein
MEFRSSKTRAAKRQWPRKESKGALARRGVCGVFRDQFLEFLREEGAHTAAAPRSDGARLLQKRGINGDRYIVLAAHGPNLYLHVEYVK